MALFLVGLIVSGCKHDPQEDEIPQHSMFVKKQVINWIAGGHHDSVIVIHPDTTLFYYDTNKRLIAADSMQFLYDTSGKLVMTAIGSDTIRYLYNGGLLTEVNTNCGYYDGGRFTDTTRFYYSGSVLQYFTSSRENSRTDIRYQNGRLLSKFISRKAGGVMRYDTLEYTWLNGNLISLRTRAGDPYISFLYQREFRYDSNPCYTSAIHYPEEYLFIREITQFYGRYPLFYYEVLPWRFNCQNNPVEFTEHTNEQTRTREWHVHYNGDGFPTEIHAEDFEVILEYY